MYTCVTVYTFFNVGSSSSLACGRNSPPSEPREWAKAVRSERETADELKAAWQPALSCGARKGVSKLFAPVIDAFHYNTLWSNPSYAQACFRQNASLLAGDLVLQSWISPVCSLVLPRLLRSCGHFRRQHQL